jgi:hypothetical protein
LDVKDLVTNLVSPRTDDAVFTQVAVIVSSWALLSFAFRENRPLVELMSGLALMALAWRGLRATH